MLSRVEIVRQLVFRLYPSRTDRVRALRRRDLFPTRTTARDFRARKRASRRALRTAWERVEEVRDELPRMDADYAARRPGGAAVDELLRIAWSVVVEDSPTPTPPPLVRTKTAFFNRVADDECFAPQPWELSGAW